MSATAVRRSVDLGSTDRLPGRYWGSSQSTRLQSADPSRDGSRDCADRGGVQPRAARYGETVSLLQACGVVKSVGRGRAARTVLDGVDLEVEPGELVAVLGRSGSGKSTLLHLLGGLDRPDAGSVAVAGESLVDCSQRVLTQIRLRKIGFVFQSFQLIEELSGEDNVLLPTRLPGAPRGGPERARRLIAELGVESVADHRPHELSGGEQQRFAIARALVNDPAIVLADEPTGNLDSSAAGDLLALLRGMSAEGRSVVMVTHERDVAAAADRVLEMSDGRLA
jgi:ABC-type lipoprotein export system ATPase subunit